jgi:hypothetical protein
MAYLQTFQSSGLVNRKEGRRSHLEVLDPNLSPMVKVIYLGSQQKRSSGVHSDLQ